VSKTPAQYAAWLIELANWLGEREEELFECDCDAIQESDTGAWIHNENECSSFMWPHADIVLREVAALLQQQP